MNARKKHAEIKVQKTEDAIRGEDPVLKEAGRFFLDIAKLVVGGVILTTIMEQDLDLTPAIVSGLLVVVAFFTLGLTFISNSKKKRR